MSGANQQNPLAQNPPADAAKRAHDEKIAKENEQYERIAEQARALLNIEKGNWRRIDGINPDDRVPDGPRLTTADISTGLIPPGVYRRGATDNHPANEFDVRVTEQGASACYKKEYRFGVLGWTRLLSDKDWDKAQGEVLDMMYAGRGRSTVTLDWPSSDNVTEKYVMRYLALAKERGMNVTFGSHVEQWLDNQSQSVRDRVYRERQAIENNYKAKAGEKEVLGTEMHDMKQYLKSMTNAEKLGDPNDKNRVEPDQAKKDRYENKLKTDMGILDPDHPTKPAQERAEILEKELNSLEKRLENAEKAKAVIEAQIKAITDFTGADNDNLVSNGDNLLKSANNRMSNGCSGARLELLAAINAEVKDLKLRREMLGQLINNEEAAKVMPDRVAGLEAGQKRLEAKKSELETKKAELEGVRDALIKQKNEIIAKAMAAVPKQVPDTREVDHALADNKAELTANAADIDKNKQDLEVNKKGLEEAKKEVKPAESLGKMKKMMAEIDNRVAVLEGGSAADKKTPLARLVYLLSPISATNTVSGVLSGDMNAAKGRMEAAKLAAAAAPRAP